MMYAQFPLVGRALRGEGKVLPSSLGLALVAWLAMGLAAFAQSYPAAGPVAQYGPFSAIRQPRGQNMAWPAAQPRARLPQMASRGAVGFPPQVYPAGAAHVETARSYAVAAPSSVPGSQRMRTAKAKQMPPPRMAVQAGSGPAMQTITRVDAATAPVAYEESSMPTVIGDPMASGQWSPAQGETVIMDGAVEPTGAMAGQVISEGDFFSAPGCADCETYGDDCLTCGDASIFNWRGGHAWVRPEAMFSFVQPMRLPKLVTTSPAGTSQANAGVLGDGFVDTLNTTTLFGGEREGDGYGTGGRISFGWWTDQEETLGLLTSWFIVEEIATDFTANSSGNPILARPFFSVNPPAGSPRQASSVLALDPTQIGSINIHGGTQVYGGDVFLQENWYRGNRENLDLLYGYKQFRLDEFLQIDDSTTFQQNPNQIPVGTTIVTRDRFEARNIFHGGELGFDWQKLMQNWTLESAFKLGLGNVNQRARISGFGVTTVPGGGSSNVTGGLLALPSNIGTYERDRFGVLLDWRAGMGYHWSPRLKLDVAYNLMYLNRAIRAGDQIDLNVNDTQIGGALAGAARPRFQFQQTDLLVHTIQVGLEYRH